MGNHMKGCGCRRCRSGMHTKTGGILIQKKIRAARRKAKRALRRGEEPEPYVSLEYMD